MRLCGLAFVLGLLSGCSDAWLDAARHRALVELDREGYPTDVILPNGRSSHPDIVSVSPDGQWTLTAHWIDRRGYTWEMKNKETGEVFSRRDHFDASENLPIRIIAFWSPGGHYLAVQKNFVMAMDPSLDPKSGLSEIVETYHLENHKSSEVTWFDVGWDMIFTGSMKPGEPLYPSRMNVVRWASDDDLEMAVYLDTLLQKSNTYVLAAAHLTLHFSGDKASVTSSRRDFHETYAGPWD